MDLLIGDIMIPFHTLCKKEPLSNMECREEMRPPSNSFKI